MYKIKKCIHNQQQEAEFWFTKIENETEFQALFTPVQRLRIIELGLHYIQYVKANQLLKDAEITNIIDLKEVL